MTSAFCSNTSF